MDGRKEATGRSSQDKHNSTLGPTQYSSEKNNNKS